MGAKTEETSKALLVWEVGKIKKEFSCGTTKLWNGTESLED